MPRFVMHGWWYTWFKQDSSRFNPDVIKDSGTIREILENHFPQASIDVIRDLALEIAVFGPWVKKDLNQVLPDLPATC